MLETKGNITPSIEGIDQQDFEKIQLLAGSFPFQIGLQQRIPGKTIQQIVTGKVGSIFVFYNVYGRHYVLTDYGTTEITEIVLPPITLPALPPNDLSWFDNFSGYANGLVSRIWAAGLWPIGIGICETLIQGLIDPFLVYATIPSGQTSIPSNLQPKAGPTGVQIPNTTPRPYGLGTPSGLTSKVFSGSNVNNVYFIPYPSGDYPADNSGWLPGHKGDLPFLPHPYNYDPADTRFFSSHEEAYSDSFYGGSFGPVEELQNSQGYYSVNYIDLSGAGLSGGEIITLVGTRVTKIDRSGTTTTENVEVVLGIYPESIPTTFTVNTNLGPKISNDISSPPGSNRENVAARTLTYTGYNIYS